MISRFSTNFLNSQHFKCAIQLLLIQQCKIQTLNSNYPEIWIWISNINSFLFTISIKIRFDQNYLFYKKFHFIVSKGLKLNCSFSDFLQKLFFIIKFIFFQILLNIFKKNFHVDEYSWPIIALLLTKKMESNGWINLNQFHSFSSTKFLNQTFLKLYFKTFCFVKAFNFIFLLLLEIKHIFSN